LQTEKKENKRSEKERVRNSGTYNPKKIRKNPNSIETAAVWQFYIHHCSTNVYI
jgi:hypothetical protein